MPYVTTQDLKEDVLFRCGEPAAGSRYNATVVDYLNRCQKTLATGASEFAPEYIDDWWWNRASGVLLIEPARTTGTVAVTAGSATVTFSSAPAASVAGWRLRVDGQPDVPAVLSHTAAATTATLDAVWTGATNPAATYTLMKNSYTLLAAVATMISPMRAFRAPYRLPGMSPEGFERSFPISELSTGDPGAFCLESETAVRFNAGGRSDGLTSRVEYSYRPVLADLTDSDSSIPAVPAEWRHVLADMAASMLFVDKNDDRSTSVAMAARLGVTAMLKHNRRRVVRLDTGLAMIYPRPAAKPVRTEGDLIIY